MPHRDLIIYQHNVGFQPMRHQYIFLWSLTYCLLLSMLFSWLADKITVAVSEITSSSSWGLSYHWFLLQTVSSFPFGVPRMSPQGELGPLTTTGPWSAVSPWQSYSRRSLANSWYLGWTQTCVMRSQHISMVPGMVFCSLLFGEPWENLTEKTGFAGTWVRRATALRPLGAENLWQSQEFMEELLLLTLGINSCTSWGLMAESYLSPNNSDVGF